MLVSQCVGSDWHQSEPTHWPLLVPIEKGRMVWCWWAVSEPTHLLHETKV